MYDEKEVLPMYMGVILKQDNDGVSLARAPHVYGGDPTGSRADEVIALCSPCIWG